MGNEQSRILFSRGVFLFGLASLIWSFSMLSCNGGDGSAGAAPPAQAGPAAVTVSYDNASSGLLATDVQAAIDELDLAADRLLPVPTDTIHLENTVSAFSYTVPAGQTLVVTYWEVGPAGGGSSIDGVPVSGGGTSTLLANSGELIVGQAYERLHGYLVPASDAPGTAIHVMGSIYVVPVGKTLVITEAFNPVDIDGITLTGATFAAANTRVFVRSGRTVSCSQANSYFHGYVF